MRRYVLGLGSNQGDSYTILNGALEELSEMLSGFKAAPFYKTRPMHIEDQPLFLNTACSGGFEGEPLALLKALHEVERRHGRDRTRERRWGERRLDIDILYAGDFILNTESLEIPHPRLFERRFALEPLLALEPYAADPVSGKSLRSICDALPDQGVTL
ncbi:MAG: 2-amino-4-hydroxy-6-hydroxymethyldihydropteridine diphosphokinase [Spirochaetaceae bacterium]|jgi:2-amino-4-hydroxy-6-hydroxymethyldihydropteridine diphosphokinase|nr:2-amino-4-hydroxy-6-hydroxymethyldihydropteridine diphosphokinase [Spirochaetaceae bacterium]